MAMGVIEELAGAVAVATSGTEGGATRNLKRRGMPTCGGGISCRVVAELSGCGVGGSGSCECGNCGLEVEPPVTFPPSLGRAFAVPPAASSFPVLINCRGLLDNGSEETVHAVSGGNEAARAGPRERRSRSSTEGKACVPSDVE